MKCDKCGAEHTSVHLTEIINGKVTEVHMCPKCAKEKTDELKKFFSMSDFLSDLADMDDGDNAALTCATCGMTYDEFKQNGRFGCASCYEAFASKLDAMLQRIHGATLHKGKAPAHVRLSRIAVQERVGQLKEQLERAIRMEEFEAAARIRDEIKQAEAGAV
jgi:protein arginine kinase activator